MSSLVLFGCGVAGAAKEDNRAYDSSQAHSHDLRPNILLIVADDLGYTDLGAYGSEINTPNIDELARSGVQLTQFYTGTNCSPTRAMLLSGVDHHLSGTGAMSEVIAPNQVGKDGYEGYLNFRVASVASLLKDAGYRTYMTGKWHLGHTDETSPTARGFDKTFVLLSGGAGHMDITGWSSVEPRAKYRENGTLLDRLPEEFKYSTDFYTDRMMEYIGNGEADDRPFFAYLAYTAPHWPLQAPEDSVEKYAGRYDDGYDKLRMNRLRNLKKAGIIPRDFTLPQHRLAGVEPWRNISADMRSKESRKMEVYAAMIDRLDVNVGRIMGFLKRTGEYDNSLIIFISDNGPAGERLDRMPLFANWLELFDNGDDSIGSKASFAFLGPGWADAISGPFRLFKGFPAEGGIRVPAIMTAPGSGNAGVRFSGPVTVLDIVPTMLAAARVEHPSGRYKGRAVLPVSGKSLIPVLYEKGPVVHGEDFAMNWELFGRRAVRENNHKLLWVDMPFGGSQWQLYDLSSDPGEQTDLIEQRPQIAKRLLTRWEHYKESNGVILPVWESSPLSQ